MNVDISSRKWSVIGQVCVLALVISGGLRFAEAYGKGFQKGTTVQIGLWAGGVWICLVLVSISVIAQTTFTEQKVPWRWKRLAFSSFMLPGFALFTALLLPVFVNPSAPKSDVDLWVTGTGTMGGRTSSVYFSHQSAIPDSEDLKGVLVVAKSFIDCSQAKAEIFGMASSPSFNDKDDLRNVDLSTRRAEAVADALREVGLGVHINPWRAFLEMTASDKFFKDTFRGQRLIERELLNRRVVVIWSFSTNSCPAAVP